MVDEWKTLKVVVEVPVRGDFTSKDLSWKCEEILEENLRHRTNRYRQVPVQFGRVRVKQFNRHVSALSRVSLK